MRLRFILTALCFLALAGYLLITAGRAAPAIAVYVPVLFGGRIEPTPTPSPTATPWPVCTPPPCRAGEVYYCPGDCPGGCGTVCATPTPGPVVPATADATGSTTWPRLRWP